MTPPLIPISVFLLEISLYTPYKIMKMLKPSLSLTYAFLIKNVLFHNALIYSAALMKLQSPASEICRI